MRRNVENISRQETTCVNVADLQAPPIRRWLRHSISACSSMMGPREVFTSLASGFMSANSSAPISPLVRLLSIRCTVRTSDRLNSSSLDTSSAPNDSARSRDKFSLHAMTFIPKAVPTAATREPMLPSPSTPSTCPARSPPTDRCHPPVLTELFSATIERIEAWISAQVSSTVGSEK
jgi:hypothetical protein